MFRAYDLFLFFLPKRFTLFESTFYKYASHPSSILLLLLLQSNLTRRFLIFTSKLNSIWIIYICVFIWISWILKYFASFAGFHTLSLRSLPHLHICASGTLRWKWYFNMGSYFSHKKYEQCAKYKELTSTIFVIRSFCFWKPTLNGFHLPQKNM